MDRDRSFRASVCRIERLLSKPGLEPDLRACSMQEVDPPRWRRIPMKRDKPDARLHAHFDVSVRGHGTEGGAIDDEVDAEQSIGQRSSRLDHVQDAGRL